MRHTKRGAESGRRRSLAGLPGLLGVLLATGAGVGALAGVPADLGAQGVEVPAPGETVYEVVLRDDSRLYARIVAVEGDFVVLQTGGGTRVEVERGRIASIRATGGRLAHGRYWGPDPSDTHLFVSPTGRSPEHGEVQVGTYAIVVPFVSVGIGGRVTVAAGAPLLVGEAEPLLFTTTVQLVDVGPFDAGAGVLALVDEGDAIGITYGVATVGSSAASVTGGVGFGFVGDDFANEPVMLLGGELRLAPRMKLLTENLFLPDGDAVLSFGVRAIGDVFAADIGMFGTTSGRERCCLPVLSLAYTVNGGG